MDTAASGHASTAQNLSSGPLVVDGSSSARGWVRRRIRRGGMHRRKQMNAFREDLIELEEAEKRVLWRIEDIRRLRAYIDATEEDLQQRRAWAENEALDMEFQLSDIQFHHAEALEFMDRLRSRVTTRRETTEAQQAQGTPETRAFVFNPAAPCFYPGGSPDSQSANDSENSEDTTISLLESPKICGTARNVLNARPPLYPAGELSITTRDLGNFRDASTASASSRLGLCQFGDAPKIHVPRRPLPAAAPQPAAQPASQAAAEPAASTIGKRPSELAYGIALLTVSRPTHLPYAGIAALTNSEIEAIVLKESSGEAKPAAEAAAEVAAKTSTTKASGKVASNARKTTVETAPKAAATKVSEPKAGPKAGPTIAAARGTATRRTPAPGPSPAKAGAAKIPTKTMPKQVAKPVEKPSPTNSLKASQNPSPPKTGPKTSAPPTRTASPPRASKSPSRASPLVSTPVPARAAQRSPAPKPSPAKSKTVTKTAATTAVKTTGKTNGGKAPSKKSSSASPRVAAAAAHAPQAVEMIHDGLPKFLIDQMPEPTVRAGTKSEANVDSEDDMSSLPDTVIGSLPSLPPRPGSVPAPTRPASLAPSPVLAPSTNSFAYAQFDDFSVGPNIHWVDNYVAPDTDQPSLW